MLIFIGFLSLFLRRRFGGLFSEQLFANLANLVGFGFSLSVLEGDCLATSLPEYIVAASVLFAGKSDSCESMT
ncbi:MAG: hypothetical protein LBK99_14905 [Opitutaceae bacterium]|nr:hypothetical protein [Opitutaceae bacterium]